MWWPCRHAGETPDLLKDAWLWRREDRHFPSLSLGWYLWGSSSGSFKWGLVTAGTSWTKLLLPGSLRRCSHSSLIGFDCICWNPQWKKREGRAEGFAVKLLSRHCGTLKRATTPLWIKGWGMRLWGPQNRPSQSVTGTSQSWSLHAHAPSPLVVPAHFLSQRGHWRTAHAGARTPTKACGTWTCTQTLQTLSHSHSVTPRDVIAAALIWSVTTFDSSQEKVRG